MPDSYTLRVKDRRIEIVHAASSDLADRLRAVEATARTLADRPGYGVLVDRRATKHLLTAAQEREIADRMAQHEGVFRGGVAMLTEPGAQYGVARMQEAFADLRDIAFEVFRDRAEAIAWLEARQSAAKPLAGT
jgi:hypothetical protein